MDSIVELYSPHELLKIRDAFLMSLRHASEGKSSSLPFITNPLPSKSIITDDTPFQVIVVGGTNYTNALVKKTDQGNEILDQSEGKMSPFLAIDDLGFFFAGLLRPDVSALAVNFAYPLKPILRDGRLDGVLIYGSKGLMLGELISQTIGELIEKHLAQHVHRQIVVSVANDVVCLVMAGLRQFVWQEIVGIVVGSGVNIGFFIDERTVVNLESGQFSDFERSSTGKQVDAVSHHPGRHPFEKEITGRYLYRHYNILAEELRLDTVKLTSTQELSGMAELEKQPQSTIARDLLERSASLVAVQIGALYRFKKRPHLSVVAEGSLFWNAHHYQRYVAKHLRALGVPKSGVVFVKIEESGLVGAARLLV